MAIEKWETAQNLIWGNNVDELNEAWNEYAKDRQAAMDNHGSKNPNDGAH